MKTLGRIIKGIGGFYYVHDGQTVYECKAKGSFRNLKIRPLPGDMVEVETEEKAGASICAVLPRKNELYRPAAANVDTAVLYFAAKEPSPAPLLIDKLLIYYRSLGICPILVFNKKDLCLPEETDELKNIYKDSGVALFVISTFEPSSVLPLKEALSGKMSVISGPSGAGKSSFVNLLVPGAEMQTGELSRKLGRGRHTTRHTELFRICEDTFIMDTPGFTAFEPENVSPEELSEYYPEFSPYTEKCAFKDCVHIGERQCAVKDAVNAGKISRIRYENYKKIYCETKDKKQY